MNDPVYNFLRESLQYNRPYSREQWENELHKAWYEPSAGTNLINVICERDKIIKEHISRIDAHTIDNRTYLWIKRNYVDNPNPRRLANFIENLPFDSKVPWPPHHYK